MSNTHNNMQTQTSNTLHNAIMRAGSKDRLPMLALGNYVQWKSRIKRYIDTKPNHELIHYCLENPPYKLDWQDIEDPVSEGSPITTTERIRETYKNVSQDIRDQLNAEAEAHEVNEIRAKKIARIANPLALVAQKQPDYHPQTHPTHYTQNSSTKSKQAATRNRGKSIINSLQPICDQEPLMVAEDEETENVGSSMVQKSRIQCYNCKEFRHVAKECQKPKRAKDPAYHREKMLLCKQKEAGIQLNAEQADWR
nr:hypothetical protein [Tanacetum cinerariifolium]